MFHQFHKSFFINLLIGGIFGVAYLLFSHTPLFMNRLINALFLAALPPLCFGGMRFAKNIGTFDLLIYSHRKLWKYGKHHEKYEEENMTVAPGSFEEIGSYYDYLSSKNPAISCRGSIFAGLFYLVFSLLLTFFTCIQ